jgi:pimeloyl-ACP methyl ester carboxylesterase
MAGRIPGAGLLVEPRVSHLASLRDPDQFNRDVLHFLETR